MICPLLLMMNLARLTSLFRCQREEITPGVDFGLKSSSRAGSKIPLERSQLAYALFSDSGSTNDTACEKYSLGVFIGERFPKQPRMNYRLERSAHDQIKWLIRIWMH